MRWIAFLAMLVLVPAIAGASALGDASHALPSAEDFLRVLSLRDHNTRVVVIGTTLLGAAAGLVGTFMLLRKRALTSDAIAHATLPGVVTAYMLLTAAGRDGKNLPLLLLGAAVTGVLGLMVVSAIRSRSRLKDDAALGIVLSIFFGLGVSLLGIATRMEGGNAAGLTHFITGKTASMLASESRTIAVAAALIALLGTAFFKELTLLCFDESFASSQGWPAGFLDALLMGLVVGVTVVGLQSVGLILIVALLVIPPAAARFWTLDMRRQVIGSSLIGALSGMGGSAASALLEDLPAGAVIVLVAALFFAISLVFGSARGVLWETLRMVGLKRRVRRQHVLRGLYELADAAGHRTDPQRHASPLKALVDARSWSALGVRSELNRLQREDLLTLGVDETVRLTERGAREAARVTRNHRLWEMFLITYADTAPAQVDRDADRIEHVLSDTMIRELEALVERDESAAAAVPPVPASPHPVGLKGDAR